MEFSHQPVLLEPVMQALALRPDGTYLDGTLGGGGHSEEILRRTAPAGRLIGIDQDDEALRAAGARLAGYGERFLAVKSNFSAMRQVLDSLGVDKVQGILLDIGVSSHQLDEGERGFSYMVEAPLDMRMDQHSDRPTAADLLNTLNEQEIADLIYKYGEERYSRRIAKQIIWFRQEQRLATTMQLVELIRRAMPKGTREKQHPAKRTFQALRIAVNDELGALERALEAGLRCLAPGGRLCVITFHSLEDRIVKEQFRAWAKGCICPPDFPACVCGHQPEVKILTGKPIVADEAELSTNPRARSAKLRCVCKL